MNRDDIIRMAREAGFVEYELEDYTPSGHDIRYERFAALVAAAEREACAKVCDEFAARDKLSNYYVVAANAIRARGQA
jgi:1,2-phenylacetyl-CoA epoxidase PaaB subunit